MTIKRLTTLPILLAATAAALLTGCLKMDRSDCYDIGPHSLIVRAYDNSGGELGKSDVSSVALYVFDGQGLFVETILTELGEPVALEPLPGQDITIVAVGNLNGNNTVSLNGTVTASHIELTRGTRADEFVIATDDVFLGSLVIYESDQAGEKEIPVYRQMGSMGITVRDLDIITGIDDGDYSIVVGETYSRIGFDGSLSGDRVSYRPALSGTAKQLIADPFAMVPEPAGVTVDIYRQGNLVASVSRDSGGNPFGVHAGQLTNVHIEFTGAGLNVAVAMTPWGQLAGWKDF